MTQDYDPRNEPMRALRDLINACECVFGSDNGEDEILDRAREAFTSLRLRLGDARPGEDIADALMIEPPLMNLEHVGAVPKRDVA